MATTKYSLNMIRIVLVAEQCLDEILPQKDSQKLIRCKSLHFFPEVNLNVYLATWQNPAALVMSSIRGEVEMHPES
jgi:hypothetical protein